MKIEKLSDHQIRCTLCKHDFIERGLQFGELLHDSDKAKQLFRDMMEQAFDEFGFESDNIPLMIEASPVSPESLVLIITKVDDPSELKDHFLKFTADGDSADTADTNQEDDTDDTAGERSAGVSAGNHADLSPAEAAELLRRIARHVGQMQKDKKPDGEPPAQTQVRTLVYSFSSLDTAGAACERIFPIFDGGSTLYKDAQAERYLLLLCGSSDSWDMIAGLLSEFGSARKATHETAAFLDEHMDTLIPADAVQLLASM